MRRNLVRKGKITASISHKLYRANTTDFRKSVLRLLFNGLHIEIMEKRKGDEHLHHPVCEVCQKEFTDTHELSVHIDQTHRKKDISR